MSTPPPVGLDVDVDITVVVVTSPSKSNPAITLIEQVLNSVELLSGLQEAPVVIVMDGFDVFGTNRYCALYDVCVCVYVCV